MDPAVDVVVVSWNTRDELLRCLQSVLASSGVSLSVVVVDNASADGSADAVEAELPAVRVVRNTANLGFARAVNQGLREGHAPLVLLLNPDAEVPVDAIRRLAERLLELPGHAVVAARLVDADGRVEHSVHPLPSLWISLLLALGAQRLLPRRLRARLLLVGAWESDVDRDVPWAVGACLLVRRAAVDEVGGLDERFFVYVEDVEWCDRLGRAGWRIRYVPSVTVTHLGNRSGAQRYGEERTAAHLGNALAFARRRHGRAWAAAFHAVNGAATVGRYAGARLLVSVRPSPERLRRERMWRAYARFYLGLTRAPADPELPPAAPLPRVRARHRPQGP